MSMGRYVNLHRVYSSTIDAIHAGPKFGRSLSTTGFLYHLEFRGYAAAGLSAGTGLVISRWVGVRAVTGGYWAEISARRWLASMSW